MLMNLSGHPHTHTQTHKTVHCIGIGTQVSHKQSSIIYDKKLFKEFALTYRAWTWDLSFYPFNNGVNKR